MEIGLVVEARPWRDGTELRPHRGLVISEVLGDVAVWFYGMGDPEAGITLQAIRANKIREVGHYTNMTAPQLRRLENAVNRTDTPARVLASRLHRYRRTVVRIDNELKAAAAQVDSPAEDGE